MRTNIFRERVPIEIGRERGKKGRGIVIYG